MKQIWRRLPGVIRWLLVTLMIMAIVAGGASAHVALTSVTDVTVSECLSWVGESTFSITLYPQEEATLDLTIANASSLDMTVDILSLITPDPGGKVTVSAPNNLLVPANGQQVFTVTVSASKKVVPGTYTITLQIDR